MCVCVSVLADQSQGMRTQQPLPFLHEEMLKLMDK